jgi:hypothetical protein
MAPIIYYIIGGCQAPRTKPLQSVGALWRQNYIMGPKKRSIGANPYVSFPPHLLVNNPTANRVLHSGAGSTTLNGCREAWARFRPIR